MSVIVQNPWMKIREAVDSADSLMTDSTKNWANRTVAMGHVLPLGTRVVTVGLMGDVEGAQCTMTIWVYAEKGPAEWVIGATWDIGAQEVVEDPTLQSADSSSLLYADTIAIVDQGWPNRFLNVIDAGGDGGLATIIFESLGAGFIKIEVSAIDGGLTVTPIFKQCN